MNREIFVYVDTRGGLSRVGRLWTRQSRSRESASFEYDQEWLSNAQQRFALEPAIALASGPHHTTSDHALFGALSDSAPDRWGRVLMRRAERRRAERLDETPRTLTETDYLLMVNDEARQGALRFAVEPGGPFLAAGDGHPIPPLIELPRLLSAADRVESDTATDQDLRLLLAPGSSLGGARPKASIRERDGRLAISKFPHQNDEIDTVRWEAVALALADKSGIPVPNWRLEEIATRPVLILRRFDRSGTARIPFLSAMSMLGATDYERHSYLDIVDALRQHGSHPKADMQQLWRRVVFNVLISNTDDHLRNHGFLHTDANGWSLSPAYDVNPTPTDLKARVLSTNIDFDDGTASIELALSVAAYFELSSREARAIAAEVGQAVATWREEAASLGLSKRDIDRMASAFEHEDLRMACS